MLEKWIYVKLLYPFVYRHFLRQLTEKKFQMIFCIHELIT